MEIFIASSTKRVKAWFYRLALLFLLLFFGGIGKLCAQFYPTQAEHVDTSVSFDESRLVQDFGFVRFEASVQTRYGFDLGTEKWYQRSVKLDEYYKPLAKDYIAPWKLIPTGEQDVITARYEGKKAIDLSRVRFASAPNSPAIPAEFDEGTKTWKLSLPATDAQSSYDVFALYEGKVIGKLRVVSYPKQSYRVRLVSVNGQSVGDVSSLSQHLNSIYNKYGVEFKFSETENIQAELSAEHIKQNLKNLRDSYEEQHPLAQDEVCVFVLSSELSKSSKLEDVEGLMPRKSRFGYIFAGNSPNTEELARTLAHELGHGLFTLGHTFDSGYNKGKIQATKNLMDYTVGATELAAYQWNIIANPAPFTAFDKIKEGQLQRYTTKFVALPKSVSSAILSTGKSVVAPNGQAFIPPVEATIQSLFYEDSSANPAVRGSIASFVLKGRLYSSFYNVHTKAFVGYRSVDKGDTIVYQIEPSQVEKIQLQIDTKRRVIAVEGKEYFLTTKDFEAASSWRRVLIQTKTKPGFGNKNDREVYEFEDADGQGLTPPSEEVADDMRYGKNFDFTTITDSVVRANLERLNKETDDQLFKRMEKLAEWVSRGNMEDQNKRLIQAWRSQVYKSANNHYSDPILTSEVFKEKSATDIVTVISKEFHRAEGKLKNINLINIGIQRPSFLFTTDLGKGLTFALNDTWGFRVTLIDYHYNVTAKTYKARIAVDIYDHFGLDLDDVLKFGSMELIRAKIGDIGIVLGEASKARNEKGYALTKNGATDAIFNELAEGFCSWFILQYSRGYKPCVTMMSKEFTIEN